MGGSYHNVLRLSLRHAPLAKETKTKRAGDRAARAVDVCLERQKLLTRPVPAPLEVNAILNEAVLHRALAGQYATSPRSVTPSTVLKA